MAVYTIITFYKFSRLENLSDLANAITAHCQGSGILGTFLLATEGINATIAGTAENIDSTLSFLRSYANFSGLECTYSYSDFMPFRKLKVRIKAEIVTLGMSDLNLDPQHQCGMHVAPEAWDALISDPEVLLIDTRNIYEIEFGTFKNAANPNTESFGEFPQYVQENLDPKQHKKIAMFCTGGIRCEKASAYLLAQGFENVYQLEGGILKYLETVAPEEGLWEGKCFIFDERVVVD